MRSTVLAFYAVCLIGIPALGLNEHRLDDKSTCALVEQALVDSNKLKPGIKRSEVEKIFVADGGLQFPDNWRYTYSRCEYIKIDVEFSPASNRGRNLTSPDDIVKKVSNLYIAYPTKD